MRRESCRIQRILCVGLAFAALPAWCAEWSAEPSVTLREEYNDNFLLTTLPHNAVWGTILTPSLKLSRRSEVSETSVSARLNFNRYAGERDLDRNDQYYKLNSSYKSERNIWAGDFSYTRDSTLFSELDETGIVQTRAQRNRLSLAPSWTRMLSERNSLRLGYQIDRVSYDSNSAGLIDYRNQSVDAGWLHQFSPKDLVTLALFYSTFQTANDSNKANTIGLQGGLTHDFSETMQGSIVLGVRSIKSTVKGLSTQLVEILPGFFLPVLVPQTLNTTDRATVLNARLEKRFETVTINGSVSREQSPTGNGSLVETDRLRIGVSRRVTENLTASANGNVYHSRYIGNAVNAADRKYYELALNLNWRMTERWRVESGYRYARLEYQSSGTAPDSNLVFASIRYDWPIISIAR